MSQQHSTVAVSGTQVRSLDDLSARLRRYRLFYGLFVVALLLSVIGLPVVFYEDLTGDGIRNEGFALTLLIWAPLLCLIWLVCAGVILLVVSRRSGHVRRLVEAERIEHLARFQWFEVWADHPRRRIPAIRWSRTERTFLQFFVHPDPAVPRFLTRGTDLVVAGGCSADDLRVVTAHLDVLLHRALLLGLDDPHVSAAIRPVPPNALPGPNSRRLYEVHDPVAARALIAADLDSGWPPPALIARYRGLLTAGSITP